jgi:hypothetical protein
MARLRSIETARTDLPAIRHFVTLEISPQGANGLEGLLGQEFILLNKQNDSVLPRLLLDGKHYRMVPVYDD